MVDPVTERTRIRRLSEKAVTERATLDAILDEGLVAHVGVVEGEQPFVIPMGYARQGDDLILHGSTGSRLMRALAEGSPACATVTIVDGLVYARSAFESSMNYRSAVILGHARRVSGDAELNALRKLSDHLLPGRWEDIRPPSKKERAATITVALPISEWSVKIGSGGPDDDPYDLATEPWSSIWAGHVPLHLVPGAAVTDKHVPAGTSVPHYVTSRKQS